MNFDLEMMDLNLTGHESHIVEKMKLYSQLEWFKRQEGSFSKSFGVPFAEVLTTRCFGFTFNSLGSNDLFHTNEYKNCATAVRVAQLGLNQRGNIF